MSFKFLKRLDCFGTSVETFVTSRHRKTSIKSFESTHGSILGGVLTIICGIISSIYLFKLYSEMVGGDQDSI